MHHQIQLTLSPNAKDIDFLTKKINEETKDLGIKEEAYAFAFFIRNEDDKIIAGCNGSVVYGTIYTDQLWVHPKLRGQGLGRKIMEKVHEYGRSQNCKMATVATMSFQNALKFYQNLGYIIDHERDGYTNNAKCLFLRKVL
jgi:GNAT superfamily N-acetyltransferase